MIIKLFTPKSIIDFGCGLGTWLKVFKENGVNKIIGVDGSYVEKNDLLIPDECFISCDFDDPDRVIETINDAKFDLAVSLEVAEHISAENSEKFISMLTLSSNIVLFSAAIPYQGGRNHINEQWQSYWAKKFQGRGFVAVDCIRPIIWSNRNIQYYYRQNIILYIKESIISDKKLQVSPTSMHDLLQLDLVHPENWMDRNIKKRISIVRFLRSWLPENRQNTII